jgi:hypothetical protein
MQTQTEIRLFRCFGCSRQVFSSDIENGQGCLHCGSLKVRPAAPSLLMVAEFFWRHPQHLKTWWKENVLGR